MFLAKPNHTDHTEESNAVPLGVRFQFFRNRFHGTRRDPLHRTQYGNLFVKTNALLKQNYAATMLLERLKHSLQKKVR
jgi:hypothetical protein